ncbi:MAG TPA: response regulator transcription factor [Treponemataceae bacterium]|nr:response regulator transcription factor [Treponemataceae bacterium]
MSVSTVVIIDDHPVFIKGLTQLINSYKEYKVIGDANCQNSAITLVDEKKPDIVIVDLNLGDEDGLDLIKNLKNRFPSITILVLSMHDERNYAERTLRAGARGYVMKDEAYTRVIDAIKTVLSGKIWLSESEHERLFNNMTSPNFNEIEKVADNKIKLLSDRQLQILRMIGKGLGTVEIASKLNLSTKTIGSHKEHIKMKLDCTSIQELNLMAIELTNNKAGE